MFPQPTGRSPKYHEEAVHGNARIRMHEFQTRDGDTRYALEVSAYNAFADQEKVIVAAAGFDYATAKERFAVLARTILDYDWTTGDLVLAEDGAY